MDHSVFLEIKILYLKSCTYPAKFIDPDPHGQKTRWALDYS